MIEKEIEKFREELMKVKALELANSGFITELMRLDELLGDLLTINIKLKKPMILKVEK